RQGSGRSDLFLHLLDPNLRNLDVTVLVFDTDGDVIGVHARLRLEPSVRQTAREDEPILDGSKNRVGLAWLQTISVRRVPSPPWPEEPEVILDSKVRRHIHAVPRRAHAVGVNLDGLSVLLPEVRLTRDLPVVTFGANEVEGDRDLPTTFGEFDRPELSVVKIVGRIPNLEGHRPGVPVGAVTRDGARDHATRATHLDV